MTTLERALVRLETSCLLGLSPTTRLRGEREVIFILLTSSMLILTEALELTGQSMLCLGKPDTWPPAWVVR